MQRLPLIFLLMLSMAPAGSAQADGAPTIAGAPLISVGQEQVNAVAGIDFWRVSCAKATG